MIFASPFAAVFGSTSGAEHPEVTAALIQLLPPGGVWDASPGAVLYATLQAVADELERVRLRGLDLIEESDPRTATETIDAWERMVGLPDAQVPELPATLEARRVAVTAKLVATGGQSLAYWTALVEAAGYTLVRIELASMTRVGARVGARAYGDAWAYSMALVAADPVPGALTQAQLLAVVRANVHAHIWADVTFLSS